MNQDSGQPLEKALKDCPACKHRVSVLAATCPNCGYPLLQQKAPPASVDPPMKAPPEPPVLTGSPILKATPKVVEENFTTFATSIKGILQISGTVMGIAMILVGTFGLKDKYVESPEARLAGYQDKRLGIDVDATREPTSDERVQGVVGGLFFLGISGPFLWGNIRRCMKKTK